MIVMVAQLKKTAAHGLRSLCSGLENAHSRSLLGGLGVRK